MLVSKSKFKQFFDHGRLYLDRIQCWCMLRLYIPDADRLFVHIVLNILVTKLLHNFVQIIENLQRFVEARDFEDV